MVSQYWYLFAYDKCTLVLKVNSEANCEQGEHFMLSNFVLTNIIPK